MFYDFIYLAKEFRMRPKVWSTLNMPHLDIVTLVFNTEYVHQDIAREWYCNYCSALLC